MRLLAVNVGLSRTIQINGQEVRTAYLKDRVDGAVRIARSGPEGNETAVHTDAVYAVSRQHYEFWSRRLGVAPEQWPAGFFAENFTLDRLDEQQLRIGDRIRVGNEVELLVAGPRIPCFKLAWRVQQPESFIREFAGSGWTGVYFSVEREGVVQAGDPVQIVERTDHSTVAAVADMVFGSAEVSTALLRSLLALPCLSQTVALGLRNRLYRILDTQQTREHRWPGWRRFRIEDVVPETGDVTSFHLVPEDRGPLPRFRAGQFLTVRVPIDEATPEQRTWSLSDFTETPDRYRISIKKETSGRCSRWMHEQITPGAVLEMRSPAGRFVLDRGSFKPVVLIGAGIGITPLLAMAKSHRARGPEAPPLYIVHCVRNSAQHPFRAELDALGANITYVYSSPLPCDRLGESHAMEGRLTLDRLAHAVRDAHIIHGGKRIDLPWYDCDLYLCGPDSFQQALLREMAAQGIDASRVKLEAFQPPASGASAPSGTLPEQATIELQRSGRKLQWHADSDGTLLDFLETNGVAVESGCRMGICHACRCKVVEGAVSYDPPPLSPPAEGVLLCCARPSTSTLLLDA